MSSSAVNLAQLNRRAAVEKAVRRIFLFVFLFTTFSGAVRKWLIDNGLVSNMILAVQLMLPFSFLLLRKYREIKSPFTSMLVIYTFLLVLLAVNPMNQSLFHGLFGIVLHLGFWLAMYVYFMNWEYFSFRQVLNVFLVIGMVEVVLGMIQYSLPSSHFLNKYVSEEASSSIATISGAKVRVTGTFSYLAGYSAFCLFFPLMLWAAVRFKYISTRLFLLFYALGLVACFMSGSRSAFYPYVLVGMLILYLEFGVKNMVSVLASSAVIIATIATLLYFVGGQFTFISSTISESYQNFDERRTSNQERGEEKGRLLGSLRDVVYFPGEYPLVGVGLGATYQGSMAVWGTSRYVSEYPSFLEEEPERIVLEGGFVLLLFKLALFIVLYRRLAIPVIAKAPLLVLAFLFFSLVYFTYSSTYFFLGLMLLDRTYRKTPAELAALKAL